MIDCKNCKHTFDGKFCPYCGQAAQLKRIDGHYIKHEIEHVLHLEKGLFLTIKELFIRPGANVKEFISDNRNRLVKPILFLTISSLIYTIINHLFHIEDGYIQYSETKKTATGFIFEWIQNHYGYANIIMGVFVALWLKLFFKKHDYNFFEILILLCFVMGIGMLIFSVFAFIEGLTKIHLLQFSSIIGFLYITWAIGQFYDQRKISSYIKAFFAYLLGMITFSIAALIVGKTIDMFLKH